MSIRIPGNAGCPFLAVREIPFTGYAEILKNSPQSSPVHFITKKNASEKTKKSHQQEMCRNLT
jgi:hypothetical protein